MPEKHTGKTCPYCQFPIKPDSEITVCPACQSPHHSECWLENDGCTTFACTGEASDEQFIDVDFDLLETLSKEEWTLHRGGNIIGVYNREQILEQDFIKPGDMLWSNHDQQWIRADQFISKLSGDKFPEDTPAKINYRAIAGSLFNSPYLGFASIIISLAGATGLYSIYSGILEPSLEPILFPSFLAIVLIGLGLAIGGLSQRNRRKTLAVTGTATSVLVMIFAGLLFTGLIIPAGECFIAIPDRPSGQTDGIINDDYSYTTTDFACDQGCLLEYRFNWDDGTYSSWSNLNYAHHAWSNPGSYNIKAQARCSQNTDIESDWSAPLALLLLEKTPLTAPQVPKLVAPLDSINVNAESITFHWEATEEADNYKIYLIRSSDGSVVTELEVEDVTSYTKDGFPNDGTDYRWRVAAGNSVGWSEWSAYWSFTNGRAQEPSPEPEPEPEPKRESEHIIIDEDRPTGPDSPPADETPTSPTSCTQQQSEKIARQFVLNSDTYRNWYYAEFKLVEEKKLDAANKWQFVYTFLTTVPAHGPPEEGKAYAQVITPHWIEITVHNCVVIEAICCDYWDEIRKAPLWFDLF